jgi:hypothetical protein
MGQESLTRFDQPKKETNKTKVSSGNRPAGENKLSQNNKSQQANTTSGASERNLHNKKTNNYY